MKLAMRDGIAKVSMEAMHLPKDARSTLMPKLPLGRPLLHGQRRTNILVLRARKTTSQLAAIISLLTHLQHQANSFHSPKLLPMDTTYILDKQQLITLKDNSTKYIANLSLLIPWWTHRVTITTNLTQ